MNSAKKTLKEQGIKPKKDPKKEGVKPSGLRTKIIVGVTTAIIVILSILIGYEQLHRPLIVKVGDSKVYLDEMMYSIFSSEAQGSYYSQLLGDAESYWNMDAGDGKTMRDAAKQEVLDNTIKNEVLYQEAEKAGYKITDEDRKGTATQVESLMGSLTEDQKAKTEFTDASLTEVLNRMAVANRYRKDLIDGFDIDDEAIKAGVDYDEYRQYDVQVYRIATTKTDDKGASTPMSDAEKKEAYNKIETLYETAKTADDFTKLIAEDDKENPISFIADSNFTTSGDWTYGDDAKEQVMKLENDKMSGIIEAEGSYIFVKMVNNNSSESYDQAVKSAITEQETAKFDEEYNKIIKNYNVKVYNNEWNKIKFGTVTV